MTAEAGLPCERCKGSGVEPDPTAEDVDMACVTGSIPIACYDCYGHGEIEVLSDEDFDRRY